ncbi:MAG: phosphoenolpyruvate-protein phosphotransferase PtsP [Gammaproteobacteria bacterium]|nr:MAG: phosphoenolpyruvate-protein phosphotransferase PtsP [Gammaproteobacteria bacterium]
MIKSLDRIISEVDAVEDLSAGLNIIVSRVSEMLAVDVCSVYLRQPDTENFVLMSSVGLNPEAVGKACLASDEGLVSLVANRAEPINLSDAFDHPNFRYIAGTGEEKFRSFLGVPIIHLRKPVGVAVVQTKETRVFSEDEVTLLMTLMAQLANIISVSEISSSIKEIQKGKKARVLAMRGVAGGTGIVIGTAVTSQVAISLKGICDREAQDQQTEIDAIMSAIQTTREEIKSLSNKMTEHLTDDDRMVFDAYVGMLETGSLIDDTLARIEHGNKWAGAAFRDTILEHVRAFEDMEDPYLRERASDVKGLGKRVLMHLLDDAKVKPKYLKGTILVGEDITPAQLAEIPRNKLSGVVCTKGSVTSHVAILARALGIPSVMGVSELPLNLVDGRRMIVDGYSGRCYLDPPRAVVREYNRLIKEEDELSESLGELRDLPAESPDGAIVKLYSNTGLISDVNYALESGSEGIGLHRTEFPFMTRDRFPGEREQTELYREILEPCAPHQVVLRTLDIGGDKALPYFPIEEDNPFLGWRGIRVTLDHPEIFATQLRSMLSANVGLGNLHVLFPMVSCLSELDESIALLDRVTKELQDEGIMVTKPQVGAMVEVPSAVYLADAIARRVDFLSIGSNDLTQYLMAVDRNNSRVADLYDELHPAVLRAILQVADAGQRTGKTVCVCGTMASDPAAAVLLFAMGIDGLSMTSSSINRIKWVIRTIAKSRAEDLLDKALLLDSPGEIRKLLNNALEEAGLGGLLRAGK